MASKSSKRRRKRRRKSPGEAPGSGSPGEAPVQRAVPRRADSPRRRGDIDSEPPPAPWGSFPLIELTVLVGIVMLVLGFIFVRGERGVILIGTGLALGSIGGLELSIREHLAGYRSHTLVLSAVPAAGALAILFLVDPGSLPPAARAVIGAAVFAVAAYLLTRLFRSRSGGYPFRLSGFGRR